MSNPLSRSAQSIARWRQPRLQIESDGEGSNHASWIELFFDLVFVVVIAELSHTLEQHLSWNGFLQFAALFVPCWWAWVLVTFYVDRYDTDDPPHRLFILVAMLAVIFLAATVHNAFAAGSVGFAVAYVTIRSIVLGLYLRATRYVKTARANLKLYLASYLPSTSLWLGSIAFAAPTRYWLWGLAMTIELLMPILGTRILAGTPAHPSHLQERFGLFTLIVLGESIVSVASATAQGVWDIWSIVAAMGGFGIAACLWWLYFNFLETAVMLRDIKSVHVFNYGHLPILMGLVLVAVGTEHTIAETAKVSFLSPGARWTLLGGVALYMSAIAFITVAACRRRFSWQMVIVIGLVLGLAILGRSLSPLVVEGLLVGLLVAKVAHQVLTTAPIKAEDRVAIEFGESSNDALN
jgi:low temperature requirement protein LtrA